MDEDLIDPSDRPLERKSLLPKAGFFVPDDVREAREAAELEAAAAGADAVVVADPDADGLACTALIRALHPDAALVPASPHDLEEGLCRAAEYTDDVPVFVCDLCPDDVDDVAEPLADLAGRDVRWFDHHQWDEDVAAAVREAGVDLAVGPSDEVCSADVAVEQLGEADLPDHLVDLARVTRDHDLWLNEDPRSADLADYAHWADPAEYVATVAEHGPDLPPAVEELLAERRVEKQELIERAVDRAARHDIGPWTVALTYGRCSQNEVADALREQGADAAVVVKPSGGVSIRGSDAFELCHRVAAEAGGGGHPRAAGCKPDVYGDVLDYAHHWTTQGAVAKQVVRGAFETVAGEVDAASGASESGEPAASADGTT
ncbi:MAG: DHH family phosphoesterase [Halobacteriaceae archaeon]